MLDIFKQFATDESREVGGTWFPLGGKSRLLIARWGNKAYSKAVVAAFEENQIALEMKGDAADQLSDEIMVDVIARTVLLGWEELAFQGQPISYSVDNAKKLLAVKDFRAKVRQFAEDVSAFKLKEEAAQGEG